MVVGLASGWKCHRCNSGIYCSTYDGFMSAMVDWQNGATDADAVDAAAASAQTTQVSTSKTNRLQASRMYGVTWPLLKSFSHQPQAFQVSEVLEIVVVHRCVRVLCNTEPPVLLSSRTSSFAAETAGTLPPTCSFGCYSTSAVFTVLVPAIAPPR